MSNENKGKVDSDLVNYFVNKYLNQFFSMVNKETEIRIENLEDFINYKNPKTDLDSYRKGFNFTEDK